MKEKIARIRALLSELEHESTQVDRSAELRGLSGLELPDLISDVVDLLMPELKPYEAAFYFYFLRHSIVENGTPYVRFSRNRMRSGVVKSAYTGSKSGGKDPDSSTASLVTVRQAIQGLEAIGAVRQEGEANRDGTLYRVLLPEEIEVCKRRRAEQAIQPSIAATEQEADYYNVRENRLKIYERDDYKCVYCGKQLTRFTATLDHVTPVSKGGDNGADNLKTACLEHNSRKTSRPLGDFLAEMD